ncbi:DUF2892 domain-containing protein [Cytophagaceae bacterium 50C-KIRBA]|uniref:DUF2892 domain-containing protein n=1 Tax=Aquirufa beregesia TaxID=2516556 RepID=A0ABX0EU86_9BACT|nr:DUF2892 domain-containing protein [Aquirufa beregesia]
MQERIIRAVAGSFILISTILAYFIDIHFLWMTIFVGLNLLQSTFTRFCLLSNILSAFGIKSESNCTS